MLESYPLEQWKTVEFKFDCTNNFRIEVSNFGRLRTFNKISDGNIINGSMINGYRIIRLKFFKPRENKIQKEIYDLQQQVLKLTRELKSLEKSNAPKNKIDEANAMLQDSKKKLGRKFKIDSKARTIHHHSLIHRIVAQYFLPIPSIEQIVVAHLDYNKLNNNAYNLKWMTPKENYIHQQKSPYVIKEKEERRSRRKEYSKATKLTVTKVMLLKKLLNQSKPIKQLVKQFKITNTQIFRIKRGENWADVPAAK